MQSSGSNLEEKNGVITLFHINKTGHPLTRHICAVQFVHKLGSSNTDCSVIFVCAPEKNLSSGLHMSHPLLFTHMPFTTSTHEHGAQSAQQEQLREHSVHHAHLHALPVDKLRLWSHSGVRTCRVAETRAQQLPNTNLKTKKQEQMPFKKIFFVSKVSKVKKKKASSKAAERLVFSF